VTTFCASMKLTPRPSTAAPRFTLV
jgi:hypothetical protein